MNIIGTTFGHWTVLKYAGKRKNRHYVLCQCKCGTERSVCVGNLLRGRSKSCRCLGPLDERFWARVDKTDNCWLWIGSKVHNGYGRIWSNGKTLLAHRFSYELHKGPIPKGLCVLHHCDVRNCVRPDHLFTGTRRDNTQDMIRKGRRGSCGTKLTPNQVREIQERVANGETQMSLAEEFGVAQTTISHIKCGRVWKEIK